MTDRTQPDDRPIVPPAPKMSPQHDQTTQTQSTSDSTNKPGESAGVAPRGNFAEGTTLGPYLLEKKLGEGGMGAVYKATHSHLDKVVAIKVLSPRVTQQTNFIVRFKREMKAVGKLEHPNIVRAMDAGEIDGIHFLSMEYVEGTDLAKLVKKRGPLSITAACKVIRQAAGALAAAHAAGIVHRDIKPSNLLISKSGQVKMLDLGLARAGDDSQHTTDLTSAGDIFGTPDYMAPEQWEDARQADPRTDLYALGCTLHFLLTGRAPFETEKHRSLTSKMTAHFRAPPPLLESSVSGVPEELNKIFARLLAKSPNDRFQSATDLRDALNPWTTNKPAAGPAPSVATAAPAEPVALSDIPTKSLSSLGEPALASASAFINRKLLLISASIAAVLVLAVSVWFSGILSPDKTISKGVTSAVDDRGTKTNIPVPPPPVVTGPEAKSPMLGKWRIYSQWLPNEGAEIEFFPSGEVAITVDGEQLGGTAKQRGVAVLFRSERNAIDSSEPQFSLQAASTSGKAADWPLTSLRLRDSETWQCRVSDVDHFVVKRTYFEAAPASRSPSASESPIRVAEEAILYRASAERGPPLIKSQHLHVLGCWQLTAGTFGIQQPFTLEFTQLGDLFMTVNGERFGGHAGLGEVRQWYRVEPGSSVQSVNLTIHSKCLATDKNKLPAEIQNALQPDETWEIERPAANDYNNLLISRTSRVPEQRVFAVTDYREIDGKKVAVTREQMETVYVRVTSQMTFTRSNPVPMPQPAPAPPAPEPPASIPEPATSAKPG